MLVERDKTQWIKIDAAIKKEIGKHFMLPAVRRCRFPFQTDQAGICGKMSQTMTERINEHVFKTESK